MVESVIGKADEPRREPEPAVPAWLARLNPKPSERSAYLEGRGLTVPHALRWARKVPYFMDAAELGQFDAMLAPVTRGDKFLGYHITYLHAGKKAPVPSPRKMLCSGTSGACCALYLFAGGELGVGEGIETCIAAHMLFQVPVWAALNTSMLASFEWPQGVTLLRIFADHDANYAGHAAAYALAHKAAKMGIPVAVHMPNDIGDWNDVLLADKKIS
ncbi:MAG: toprim domain-containing protein [Acidobacteriaceae bacterium]